MTSSIGSSRPTRFVQEIEESIKERSSLSPSLHEGLSRQYDTTKEELLQFSCTPGGLERSLDALLAEDRAETVTCHRVITVMLYLIRRLQKRRR